VGSDDKIGTAKQFGAEQVINYQRENFADAVLSLTGGRGVDAVIDGVAAPSRYQSLAPFGRLRVGRPQVHLTGRRR
jgi:NADPH:quinone reductase-like Zn-dependent oxidoreductase